MVAVKYVPATNDKFRIATYIEVTTPDGVVYRTLGGRYSQEQALADYKRNKTAYKPLAKLAA